MSKPVMIDSDNSERYIVLAAAKSVAGIGVPEFSTAHNRAKAVFCVQCTATSRLWWAGQGHRKMRRYLWKPVTPTLFGSPPVRLASVVVIVQIIPQGLS